MARTIRNKKSPRARLARCFSTRSNRMTKSYVLKGKDAAALARCKLMMEALRTLYISKAWSIDEEAAARVLKYFAHGCPNNDGRGHRLVHAFCKEHGQSVDWLFDGRVPMLIAVLASHSPRNVDALARGVDTT